MNLLIALVDEYHVHHSAATDWLGDNLEQGWATCPLTQNGCLRILSQPSYSNPMSIVEAVWLLRDTVSNGYHQFVADDISLIDEDVLDISSLSSHRQLTDVYLLSLAVEHDFRFVTFDRGVRMATVGGAEDRHLVVI